MRWLGSLRLSSRLSSPFLSPLGPACLSLAPGYSQPSSPVNTFSLVISNWIETLCQYFRTCHVIKWDSLSQQMSNFSTLINEMRYNQMKRFGLFVGGAQHFIFWYGFSIDLYFDIMAVSHFMGDKLLISYCEKQFGKSF